MPEFGARQHLLGFLHSKFIFVNYTALQKQFNEFIGTFKNISCFSCSFVLGYSKYGLKYKPVPVSQYLSPPISLPLSSHLSPSLYLLLAIYYCLPLLNTLSFTYID